MLNKKVFLPSGKEGKIIDVYDESTVVVYFRETNDPFSVMVGVFDVSELVFVEGE